MNPFGLHLPEPDPEFEQNAPLRVGRGAAFGAAVDDALSTSLTGLSARGLTAASRNLGRAVENLAAPGVPRLESDPYLSAEDANAAFGIEGVLSFDAAVPESRARELYQIKSAEAERQALLSRSDATAPELFAVGLSASFLDPLGAAASVLPVGALARSAPVMGRLARSSSLSTRLGVNAVEGVAGAAGAEAAIYPLASVREQRDYTVADSLLNLVVGGGFGAATGAMGYAFMPGAERRARQQAEALNESAPAPQPVRQAAMEGAIADLASDQPVSTAGEVMQTYRAIERERLETPGEPIATRPLRRSTAITPTGSRVDVEYALVEVDDLITSHTDDFRRDPRFPEALQPRDRTRAAMQMQVEEISRHLDPERLGETFEAGSGAPVIAPDGIVESGNGRGMSIRRAYANGKAEAYRDWLTRQGFNTKTMAAPVLVRVRTSQLDARSRIDFVRDANTRATAGLSAAEQALTDARSASAELFDLYQGGDPAQLQNTDFQRAFIERVVPAADRNIYQNADGALSPEGLRRLNDFLSAWAYDDLNLITALTENEEAGLKSLGGALRDAAADMGQLRAAIQRGDLHPDLDPAPAIGRALQALRVIRENGISAIDTVDAFDGVLDLDAYSYLARFHVSGDLNRLRSRESLAKLISTSARIQLDRARGALMEDPRHVTVTDAALESLDTLARAAEREPGRGEQRAAGFRSVAEAIRARRSAGIGGEGGGGEPRGRSLFDAPEPEARAEIGGDDASRLQSEIEDLDALLSEDERAAAAEADGVRDPSLINTALRAAARCLLGR